MRTFLNRNLHILYFSVFSFAASFVFFRPNLSIQLGPIDDHEIVRFLGDDKQLWIWQIPGVLLQQTEVGQYGEIARYRPVYYILRLLETSAFGIDSHSWYFSRIFMVALTCLFLTLGLTALLSFKNKLVIVFFGTWFILTILGLSAWQGILVRLGPSEVYLVLGISLFFYFATLLLSHPNSIKIWILTCLTVVAVVGSKENGILIIFPYLIIGVYVYYHSAKKREVLWLLFSTFAVSLFISTGWILGVRDAGSNIYGQSIGKQFVLDQLAQHLRETSNSWQFLFSFSVVLIHIYANVLTGRSVGKEFYFIIISHVVISFVLLGESIFYPQGFSELRYAIVTQLLGQLSLGLSAILVINTISILRVSDPILVSAVVLAFIAIMIKSTYSSSIVAKANFESIAIGTELTNAPWQAHLNKIVDDLSKKDFDVVVIQMNNVWDYEPAYATSQYLKIYASGQPRYLHLMPFPAGPGIEATLLEQLKIISKSGDAAWLIEPKASLDSGYMAYCVTFRNAAIDPNLCDN
jgi:hypothetical protein